MLLAAGDDDKQHYTNAAFAHVAALKQMQSKNRDIVVLLNEKEIKDEIG